MINSPIQHPFSLGMAFVAYCFAVTAAALVFLVTFGSPSVAFGQMLILFGVGWLVVFVIALVPFCIAIAVARYFSIVRWWYFTGGGLFAAAALGIPHAWVVREGPPLGPFPDSITSLAQSYIHFAPSFWLSGSIAGFVCWWFLRQKRVQS